MFTEIFTMSEVTRKKVMRTTGQSSDTNWKQTQHDEFGNYNGNGPVSTPWEELRICMGIPRNTQLFWEIYVLVYSV